jgi:hypothetical protein
VEQGPDRVVIFDVRMVKMLSGTIRSLWLRPSRRSTLVLIPGEQREGTIVTLKGNANPTSHHAPGSVPLMVELIVLAAIVAVIFIQLVR